MLFTLFRVSPRAGAALSLLLPCVLLIPGSAITRSEAPPQSSAQSSDGHEVWWNEEWARIVALRGSWKASSEADGLAALRPDDPSSSIAIMSRSTGEVFEFVMDPDGEVVLSSGWIMVSPTRRAVVSRRVDLPDQAPLPSGNQGPPNRYGVPQVERMTWYHPKDLVAFRTAGSRRLVLYHSAAGLVDARVLEVHFVARSSRIFAATDGEWTLSITQISHGHGQSDSLRISAG